MDLIHHTHQVKLCLHQGRIFIVHLEEVSEEVVEEVVVVDISISLQIQIKAVHLPVVDQDGVIY